MLCKYGKSLEVDVTEHIVWPHAYKYDIFIQQMVYGRLVDHDKRCSMVLATKCSGGEIATRNFS
jgi:hypothetical protein